MADQAKISRIDSLERFRAALIVFIHAAQRQLDDTTDEVRRTRLWLQGDQLAHWQLEIRKRQKKLDMLEQEMFAARLSGIKNPSPQLVMAIRRAKEAVREGEDKLRNVKLWIRNFDNQAEPLTRKLESLRYFLSHDMPKALVFLVQAQQTLEAYAEVRPPGAAPAPNAPAPGPQPQPQPPES